MTALYMRTNYVHHSVCSIFVIEGQTEIRMLPDVVGSLQGITGKNADSIVSIQ